MSLLEERLKAQAHELGFDLVGIAEANPPDTLEQYEDWLAAGCAGEMGYLQRHAAARHDPASILPGVRTVVMVGMNYKPKRNEVSPPPSSSPSGSLSGRVARYARGGDYHEVLRERLNHLLAWVQEQVPGCHGRGVVDTAPLLERDFARRAGLGWFGKNTMLLNKHLGSYFVLGALLLDITLHFDPPQDTSHCGRCTACLDACPTQAFTGPYRLDSRRCISYLTIELKGPIPEEFRDPMGDWIFGCDVCQEVCPWNRKAPAAAEPAFQPRPELHPVDLLELFKLDEAGLRQRVRGTALARPKRRGLLRNAAIVLGNLGDPRALPVLERAATDADPVVSEAARWAIDRIHRSASVSLFTPPEA